MGAWVTPSLSRLLTASTFPAWFTQQLRVGYYSAVTHMDWHFGMVLKALEATGAGGRHDRDDDRGSRLATRRAY